MSDTAVEFARDREEGSATAKSATVRHFLGEGRMRQNVFQEKVGNS